MSKKTALNHYLLSAARVIYVFGTITAVLAALAMLNFGGY